MLDYCSGVIVLIKYCIGYLFREGKMIKLTTLNQCITSFYHEGEDHSSVQFWMSSHALKIIFC